MKTQVRESKRVMRLIVPHIGLLECRVCGIQHNGLLGSGGRWKRGVWQCRNGCTLPTTDSSTQSILAIDKEKTIEVKQSESPSRTEVTDLFCKCINTMAYGHQFDFTKGRYYKVQRTAYQNTKTGGYTARYLAAAKNFGGSEVFMLMFDVVPDAEFKNGMIQQRFDL